FRHGCKADRVYASGRLDTPVSPECRILPFTGPVPAAGRTEVRAPGNAAHSYTAAASLQFGVVPPYFRAGIFQTTSAGSGAAGRPRSGATRKEFPLPHPLPVSHPSPLSHRLAEGGRWPGAGLGVAEAEGWLPPQPVREQSRFAAGGAAEGAAFFQTTSAGPRAAERGSVSRSRLAGCAPYRGLNHACSRA